MRVQIQAYRVIVASKEVEIEFSVILPTGDVSQKIVATEETLRDLAVLRSADTWDEREIVALLGQTFKALGDTVTV